MELQFCLDYVVIAAGLGVVSNNRGDITM